MWLNEFKSGDIVVDNFGNKLEIKQVFKTENVKIKVLDGQGLECYDFSGNIVNPESIGKTYTIYPFGGFGNDWELVEKEVIQISTPNEILTVEQIDSQISELQKKKEEIVKNQLNNLVPGKFYQIVDNEDSLQVGSYNTNVGYYDYHFYVYDMPGTNEIGYDREYIKSIKPLPELDEAYSKFRTVLEKILLTKLTS